MRFIRILRPSLFVRMHCMAVEITHRAVSSAVGCIRQDTAHVVRHTITAESEVVCSHSIRRNDKLVRNSPSAWIIALEMGELRYLRYIFLFGTIKHFRIVLSSSSPSTSSRSLSTATTQHIRAHYIRCRHLHKRCTCKYRFDVLPPPHYRTTVVTPMHDVPTESFPVAIFHTMFT